MNVSSKVNSRLFASKKSVASKSLNVIMLFVAIILLTSIVNAKTYYVSTSGVDTNDGLSVSTPIKTIAKVNTITLVPGDSVLFKRGDVWRLPTDAYLSVKSGSSSGYVTYGAYGTGNKPLFLGSYNLTDASKWSNGGSGNLWNFTGSVNHDIGNMIYNDEAFIGVREAVVSSLNSQGEFYADVTSHRLMVYSVSNPAIYYSSIEAADARLLFDISGKSYVKISDLSFKYGGDGAIGCSYGPISYVNINNVTVRYMGGYYQSGTLRAGNGIGFCLSSNNIYVGYSNISEVWDAGISPQAWASAGTQQIINHTYEYNIIDGCAYGFEYFNSASTSTTANLLISHNTIMNSGRGWSSKQPTHNSGRTLRLSNSLADTSNVVIKDNIFGNSAYRELILAETSIWNGDITFSNNLWNQSSSTFSIWQGTTYNTYNNWKISTGQDKGGQNSNPLFLTDTFQPQAGSPACTMSSTGSYVGALPCKGALPSPVCGDNSCNGAENCSSCSADCGACPIPNSAPTQSTPILSASDKPYNTTDATLNCYNQSTKDADGNSVTNTYRWFKNSVLMSGLTTNTVSAPNTATGEVWICEIKPYDGKAYGISKNSSALTINALPDITSVNFNASTINNYTTNNLTCYVKATGAINSLTVYYTIYNGSKVYASGSKAVTKNTLSAIATVSSTMLAANQTWKCSVQASYNGVVNESSWSDSSITIRAVPQITIPGLQGSWDLATTYVDSIKGNKAVAYGNTIFVGDATYGSVLKFNKSNSYLKITYADGSLTPQDGFTVDVKVKFNSVRQGYLARDTNSYLLQQYKNGATSYIKAGVYSNGAYYTILDSPTTLQMNKWYRVTYTYDKKSGVFKLYLDKNLNIQKTWTGTVDTSASSQVFVGNREQLDRWLDGSMHDLRIYNRALSDAEVSALQ